MTARKKAGSAPATADDFANFKFEAINPDLTGLDMSLAAWLVGAINEHTLFKLAVAALNKNDVELADCVKEAGAEPMLALLDDYETQLKSYKTLVKTLKLTSARLLCSLSRAFPDGEEAGP